MKSPQRLAVLVPCYNEQVAISAVIRDFRTSLPTAAIYVYDNNSQMRPPWSRRRAAPW